MKLLVPTLCAIALAAPATAQTLSFGGIATIYGGSTNVPDQDDANYDGSPFSFAGLEASIGGAASGGFGWQADLQVESATGTGGTFYTNSGLTLHGNFDLGNFTAGGFIGAGRGDAIYNGDTASLTWYGVEAAGEFGDLVVAGQLGVATSDNTHTSLSYTNYPFWAVEARYFISDDFMISGQVGTSKGDVHGDGLTNAHYQLDATMRLGDSNFFGNFGVRGNNITTIADAEGHATEAGIFLGISMLFGGGSLRDTYSGPALMIDNAAQTYTGSLASTLD